MNEIDRILDYWFGAPGSDEHGTDREMWFSGGPEIDAEISKRFGALHQRAAAGELDRWRDEARACLALILLLDQFPRNMFRGESQSFTTDGMAVEIARHAVVQGYDRGLDLSSQQFYYLPFEHSEDLADQRRSVELFRAGAAAENKEMHIGYAVRHLEIIERFGRFPHRNAILGRHSTPEELKFLADGGEDVHFGTQPDQGPATAHDD